MLREWGICAFALANVLRATAVWNFSTSELQKVLRGWGVFVHFQLQMCFAPQQRAIFQLQNLKSAPRMRYLHIFTCKCASRHSGVQFFDIRTSKSAPKRRCWVHFHCETCFSRQRRANLIYPLATWLRARRFNGPTIRLTRRMNHWNNTAFATSLTFGTDVSSFFWLSRYCIFFLLPWLLYYCALHLLFNSPYCRKFLFKQYIFLHALTMRNASLFLQIYGLYASTLPEASPAQPVGMSRIANVLASIWA